MKIAMISEHASPLAAGRGSAGKGLGGADGGGQNVFVAELAAELAAQGHLVTVYTRRDSAALPERVPFAPGVTVEHLLSAALGVRQDRLAVQPRLVRQLPGVALGV
ncbi:glycosyltransferase, partial [Actinomadura sp. NPDC048032]|uniref:glycosyltransferase n=1 Tax=Actinomadura sp. NPDC048032 TaxID=3155747 RepID=UPI0034117138